MDETEKGWFIQYIDKDPKLIAKQAQAEQRQRSEIDEEERIQRLMESQIAAAQEHMRQLQGDESDGEGGDGMSMDGEGGEDGDEGASEGEGEGDRADREEACHPISINLGAAAAEKKKKVLLPSSFETLLSGTSNSASNDSDRMPLESSHHDEEERQGISDKGNGDHTVDRNSTTRTNMNASTKSIGLSFSLKGKSSKSVPPSRTSGEVPPSTGRNGGSAAAGGGGGMSSLDAIMLETERQKTQQLQSEDKLNRKDYWLHPNIVVKLLNKDVGGGKYYGCKGKVLSVKDVYIAEVLLDGGTVVRVDQQDLQTVIPKVETIDH